MQKHHMLENGDTVIVGVSGGADSVCLLSVLSKLQEDMELNIIVAHVNHMFRETAVRDEEFTVELIPVTREHTALCERKENMPVNLEADLMARYAARYIYVQSQQKSNVTMQKLFEAGFVK